MAIGGKFVNAPRAGIIYSLEHVCYYQLQDSGKVKIHLSNGDSKDLEGEDARAFLSEIGSMPVSPSQAA
ncbi:MAG: hypothetical protein ACRD2H_08340 [Terriglobales bacterium]